MLLLLRRIVRSGYFQELPIAFVVRKAVELVQVAGRAEQRSVTLTVSDKEINSRENDRGQRCYAGRRHEECELGVPLLDPALGREKVADQHAHYVHVGNANLSDYCRER